MTNRLASALLLSSLLPLAAVAQESAVLAPDKAAVPAPDKATETPLAIAFDDAKLAWGPCPAFIPAGCQVAVLHGDPARENADIYFKVPGGFSIPRHWHTSAERMVLVSGELTVTYEGQPAVTLKPGMYAYGPARTAHEATCAQGAPCVLFIAFEQAIDAFASDEEAQ